MPTARTSALQARRFAALGDPTRLQVFTLIARSPLSVAEVAERLPVSRPAVSEHLRAWKAGGLVRDRAPRHPAHQPRLLAYPDGLWTDALAAVKELAETTKPDTTKE